MSSLSTRMKGLIDQAQDALADMTPRDRSLLVGLVVFAIVLIVGGGAWWMTSTLDDLESRVEDREFTLQQVRTMAVEHASAQGQAQSIEEQLRKYNSTDLSSFMEQAAKTANVQDRLDSVREKSTASDGNIEEKLYAISLNRLTLQELSDFLYEVETSGYPLRIKTFKVKSRSRRGEKLLNVDMDVSAFRVLADETTAPIEEG